MIDNNKAKEVFKNYVQKYDATNPRIALKIAHTYRVTELSRIIAENQKTDIDLAELIGLLHDIGRFEQLRRYDSFVDRNTIDHAELGIEVLKENNFLSEFCKDTKYHETIITAIHNHNKFRIEPNLDKKVLTQCKIIRDSDKIDILRQLVTEKFLTLYKKEEIKNQEITENIYEELIKIQQPNRKEINTDLDDWIIMVSFIFDTNFAKSFQIIKHEDFINKIIDRVDSKLNHEKLEKIRQVANQYVESHC